MTEKQELNERLAKWAGFTIGDYPEPKLEPDEKGWYDPKGKFFSGLRNFINFTYSLDACFEWLVPKLQDEGYQIDIVCLEHKGFAVSPFYVLDDQTRPLIDVRGDDLVLALCLAIDKLIAQKSHIEK